MPTDPKAGKRIVDPAAVRAFMLSHRACAACGASASNAHHVVQKGSPHFGDDVWGNLLAICGTGTMRCHGAYHGSPYDAEIGRGTAKIVPAAVAGVELHNTEAVLVERRDAEWVARRLGLHIVAHRLDVVAYVLGRLGRDPGLAFLERAYFVAPEFVG